MSFADVLLSETDAMMAIVDPGVACIPPNVLIGRYLTNYTAAVDRLDALIGPSDQRRSFERRATRTSITSSGSRSFAPRRSRSAAANSSTARRVDAGPSRR